MQTKTSMTIRITLLTFAVLALFAWTASVEAGCHKCVSIAWGIKDCDIATTSNQGCVEHPLRGCEQTVDEDCEGSVPEPGTEPEERGYLHFNEDSGQWQLALAVASPTTATEEALASRSACAPLESYLIY